MKYGIMSIAMLLTLVFAPLNVMAAKVTSDGEGEVIHLSKLCFQCLLHCAKNKDYGDKRLKECAEEVCQRACKTGE